MASFAELVLSTSRCTCPCRSFTRKPLNIPPLSGQRLVGDTKPLFRSGLGRISVKRRFLTAVARAESDQLGDDDNSKVNTLYFLLLEICNFRRRKSTLAEIER